MKRILIIIMLFNFMNLSVFSQSYDNLWKQVATAKAKDQPRTQMEILGRIVARATEEKSYGQLIAASLLQTGLEYEISPDSLPSRLSELEQMEAHADTEPLHAIYSTVLSIIYRDHPSFDDDGKKQQYYMKKALSHPEILTQTKAGGFHPFISDGRDSRYYDDDLLHVIGLELDQKQQLHDWYETHGSREAACLLATDLAEGNLTKLDSIIGLYSDLPVCGHTALARYHAMPKTTNTERLESYDFLNQALTKWSTWVEKNDIKNELTKLTTAQFIASVNASVIHPKQLLRVLLSDVRNISSFKIRVTKTKLKGNSNWVKEHRTIGERDYSILKKLLDRSEEQTFSVSFQGKPPYELNTDSLELPSLPVGVYLLEIAANDSTIQTQRLLFSVSNLRLIWQYQPNKKIRLAVVRADNGQPVPNATVIIKNEYNSKTETTVTTNRMGEVIIPQVKNAQWSYFFVSTPEDNALPLVDASGMFSYDKRNSVRKCVRIFTDRSIYRPGQSVYASLMAWTERETESKVQANKSFTLVLRDANGREVARKDITTDDMGTATAEFHLPVSGLTGKYSIYNEQTYESTFIQVEEYKRPTFEVNFEAFKDKYAPGDTIILQGTARTYSGVPVQGAKVSYSVVRRPALWWRWWTTTHDVENICSDTTVTDDDGHFQVRVPLMLGENRSGFYNFEVRADVTDAAGESHQGTTAIPLGSKETAISTDLGEKILVDDACSFSFQYRNAAGENMKGTVRYGFFASSDPAVGSELDPSRLTLTAEANAPISLPKLKSGGWTLLAVCGSDTLRHDFVVFSLGDKHPAVKTHDWFYQTSEYFPRDGQSVCVQVGASDTDQHIVYSVIAGDKVLENGHIDQSNALTLLKFKYKEQYGNGLRLCFAWVHDGICYEHSTTIERPLPEKQLKLTWRTFRDRLTPGQQEEWTLEVNNPDGTPANATLMATLYDKSLDALRLHKWNDEINISPSLPYAKWIGCEFSVWPLRVYGNPKMLSTTPLLFSHFAQNYYGALLWDLDNVRFYCDEDKMQYDIAPGTPMLSIRFKAIPRVFMCKSIAMDEERMMTDTVGAKATPEENAEGADEQTEKATVQLRENLQETAFFYPQLRTDSQGVVSLRFRLPESVTTWHFMGLAHDTEMRHAMIEANVVAQKEVMVQPNLPRFIRVGDQAVIAARISNTSGENRSGKATLQLADPANDSIIFAQEQPFTVEEGQTVSVAFSITPSSLEGHEGLVVARFTAEGDGFGDGEQHYLPILTNRKYVTATLPFTQNEPDELRLSLSPLFKGKGIAQPRLTIEYTENPSWLLMQALPFIGDSNEKNAISLSASVYTNALGKYIIDKNPRVKAVFKTWEHENGADKTLQSQLEKDEALKEMVISETPWVNDALSETEQRVSLASFFDENKMETSLTRVIDKLRKLQHHDGSFSWWEGMDGSFYMTMAVTKMFARLQVMVGEDAGRSKILANAFRYLDNEVAKKVENLKERQRKGEKDIFPSDALCDYLYVNALTGRARSRDTDYLLELLTKAPTKLSIYGKANTAVILSLYGYTKRANEYLESLRQYTVYKEEMGRYFDTPRAVYSWFDYRIPSQVAAIEALRRLDPNDTTCIREMQRWLLQSKRTQAWDTPISAVDAIWAFADNGEMEQLGNNNSMSVLSVDGKSIPVSPSAGLGYVRHTETFTEIPQLLSVEKHSQGTSWGAVYAQYFQPASEVQSASAGLTIRRELLLRDGSPATVLKLGDRVRVRITIEADRDYDFVAVEDMRAACLEPVSQWSGYRWGYYLEPRDHSTRYFFDQMTKGKHVIETEYYIDREGDYLSGTCTAQCMYAPEFSGRTGGERLVVVK